MIYFRNGHLGVNLLYGCHEALETWQCKIHTNNGLRSTSRKSPFPGHPPCKSLRKALYITDPIDLCALDWTHGGLSCPQFNRSHNGHLSVTVSGHLNGATSVAELWSHIHEKPHERQGKSFNTLVSGSRKNISGMGIFCPGIASMKRQCHRQFTVICVLPVHLITQRSFLNIYLDI